MVRLTLCVFLCLSASLEAQKSKQPATLRGNQRLALAAQEAASSIRQAKLLLVSVSDRAVRAKLESLLSKAEGSVAVIQADTLLGAGAVGSVLNNKEFGKLLSSVKQLSFSKKKSQYLVDYVKLRRPTSARLSSEQVKQLVAEVQFDKDRIPAAVALHGVTADPENFLYALDAFTFEKGREAVLQQIRLRNQQK